MTSMQAFSDSVIHYCAHIASDRLLVQGAGGNVSWKDGDTLFVKASGAWLADAARKGIFVPVNLAELQFAMESGNFEMYCSAPEASHLRPSIEAALHALMPHRLVVHLHAVDILAHLVRGNCDAEIASLAKDTCRWSSIGYFRPGADLARAVYQSLKESPNTDVLFLRNHGVVIGGATVKEVHDTLTRLIRGFKTQPQIDAISSVPTSTPPTLAKHGYRLSPDPDIHNLAIEETLFRRLRKEWALYPDHVVFLGPGAVCFDHPDDFVAWLARSDERPNLVFVRDFGVFEGPGFGNAERAQITCYYDVLVRQTADEQLSVLGDQDIASLLHWDAEKYRRTVSY